MTDLTELWQKGELQEGDYFLDIGNDIIIDYWVCNHWNWIEYDSRIKEVLCECPTYEEYQALLSDQLAKQEGEEINAELEARLKKTQELELELRKENARLKELLKECESSIQYYQETYGAMDLDTYTLLAKLKDALK